jgi:hypothetical protein
MSTGRRGSQQPVRPDGALGSAKSLRRSSAAAPHERRSSEDPVIAAFSSFVIPTEESGDDDDDGEGTGTRRAVDKGPSWDKQKGSALVRTDSGHILRRIEYLCWPAISHLRKAADDAAKLGQTEGSMVAAGASLRHSESTAAMARRVTRKPTLSESMLSPKGSRGAAKRGSKLRGDGDDDDADDGPENSPDVVLACTIDALSPTYPLSGRPRSGCFTPTGGFYVDPKLEAECRIAHSRAPGSASAMLLPPPPRDQLLLKHQRRLRRHRRAESRRLRAERRRTGTRLEDDSNTSDDATTTDDDDVSSLEDQDAVETLADGDALESSIQVWVALDELVPPEEMNRAEVSGSTAIRSWARRCTSQGVPEKSTKMTIDMKQLWVSAGHHVDAVLSYGYAGSVASFRRVMRAIVKEATTSGAVRRKKNWLIFQAGGSLPSFFYSYAITRLLDAPPQRAADERFFMADGAGVRMLPSPSAMLLSGMGDMKPLALVDDAVDESGGWHSPTSAGSDDSRARVPTAQVITTESYAPKPTRRPQRPLSARSIDSALGHRMHCEAAPTPPWYCSPVARRRATEDKCFGDAERKYQHQLERPSMVRATAAHRSKVRANGLKHAAEVVAAVVASRDGVRLSRHSRRWEQVNTPGADGAVQQHHHRHHRGRHGSGSSSDSDESDSDDYDGARADLSSFHIPTGPTTWEQPLVM